jgi:hypothetical protein
MARPILKDKNGKSIVVRYTAELSFDGDQKDYVLFVNDYDRAAGDWTESITGWTLVIGGPGNCSAWWEHTDGRHYYNTPIK